MNLAIVSAPAVMMELDPTHLIAPIDRDAISCTIASRRPVAFAPRFDADLWNIPGARVLLELDPTHNLH